MQTPELTEPIKNRFTIQVLGVGGAGGNAVSHLAPETGAGVSLAVLNTDAAALARSCVENRISLGARSMRGLGAGGDPLRGRAAAEEDAAGIRTLCQGADLVFVVAGLGGGTGTGGAPVVARIAKEGGALVLGVAIMPFDFEGSRRMDKARTGLEELKCAADGVICLPNQKVFKLIDDKTGVLEAFRITNDFIAQGVRGLARVLTKPGQINVDFADLCSVLRGRHRDSALASVEARGENRCREIVERLLAHPLIDGGQGLGDATGVLVCITGGPDLGMAETTRIMEQVSRHCELAHIVMGVSVDEDLADRLGVTLLASRGDAPGPDGTRNVNDAVLDEGTATTAAVVPPFNRTDSTLPVRETTNPARPAPRFVAPSSLAGSGEAVVGPVGARGRTPTSRMKQGQLPLEIVSKGRFEKSEPTVHHGQDLDVPTYIRRGVALN